MLQLTLGPVLRRHASINSELTTQYAFITLQHPIWRFAGGRAFFFFYFAYHSPDYESPEFRQFCEACYRVHHFKRSLSLAGLQAVLTAAAAREPLTYETLAGRTGQSYSTIAVLAGLLSDGRGPRPGLGLLRKIPGEGRRQIKLVPSRTGLAVARVFAKLDLEKSLGSTFTSSDERRLIVYDHLHNRALPALRLALAAAPDIQLSTFCVLLLVCQKQDRFAYHGDHSSVIAKRLSLSSLPRNLDRLSEGYMQINSQTKERIHHQGYGLVELHKKSTDRRVTLPALSPKGAELMSNITAALRNKPPSPVRVAKTESLLRASDPEEVRRFGDDDFDDIEWQ